MTSTEFDTEHVGSQTGTDSGCHTDLTVLESVGPLSTSDDAAVVVAETVSRARSARVQKTLRSVDTTRGRGLEVGPLYSPMVTKDEGDVWYVDIDTTEALRAHYAPHTGVPVDDIVQVDIPLTHEGQVRSIAEAVSDVAPFDWAVASHVIEHVPDVITWLADVAEVLEDDGLLALAVPDRRYCFDARRPPTTVGEMLLAFDTADVRPSVRAVFDHHAEAVTVTAPDAWRSGAPGIEARIHDLPYVRSQVEVQRSGVAYVDCHVWLFTPAELVTQLNVLADLGLVDFVVEDVTSTAVDDMEFFLTLRRLPRGLSAEERRAQFRVGFPVPEDERLPEVVEPEVPEPVIPEGAASRIVTDREMRLIEAKRAALGPLRRLAARLGG